MEPTVPGIVWSQQFQGSVPAGRQSVCVPVFLLVFRVSVFMLNCLHSIFILVAAESAAAGKRDALLNLAVLEKTPKQNKTKATRKKKTLKLFDWNPEK